jgi:formamidopyrimidine-DNA glycosylase
MPELPEVERAARVWREAILGRALSAVRTLHPVFDRTLPPADADRLVGRVVTAVTRRGKHQLATLDDGSVLDVHFGMTGEWVVGRVGETHDRYARVLLDCADGTRVMLCDARALGGVRLHRPGAAVLPTLGPEPVEGDFTAEVLGATLRRRRGPIKPVLLDQRVVAGLGNIYAAEALWWARIDPRTPGASIGPVRRERLVRGIRAVLRRAPAARYEDQPAGEHEWRVYDREGKSCRRCGGRVARIVQAGRSTYFCRRCQR